MRLWVGTSGFSYKEWKGSFYPEDLAAREMLRYYAERLPAVEINNTFYRMPKASVLQGWAEQVPEGFRFVLKAPRRITHLKRLREVDDDVTYLAETASTLGARLGPTLFQLPPYLRRDTDRLSGFLKGLPEGFRAAVEFRHPSWHDEEVATVLRERGVAWVAADTGEGEAPPLVSTADFGYARLRRQSYDGEELRSWAERLCGAGWRELHVFFKHEESGAGPALARRFAELVDEIVSNESRAVP